MLSKALSVVSRSLRAVVVPALSTMHTSVSLGKSPYKCTPTNVYVLSIGDDTQLLQSRHLVLKAAGFKVLSMPSQLYLEDDVLRSFDVLLLCHTVGDRTLIAKNVGMTVPGIGILFLGHGRLDQTADIVKITSTSPTALLRAIRDAIQAQGLQSPKQLGRFLNLHKEAH